MKFPAPPWNLFDVCTRDEIKKAIVRFESAGIPCEIKHDPNERKPYAIWVHDDRLTRAINEIYLD